jgi:hypothetical protein
MEPVSLGIGIIGLFQTAATCFTCVRIVKSSGSDLQIYMLRLVLVHLRLSRWGKLVGLTEKADDVRSLKTGIFDPQNIEIAESLLERIVVLFKATEKTTSDSSKTPKSDTGDDDNLIKQIRNISIHRQRKLDIVEKVKWCLYARKEMASLIENLEKLIGDLYDLSPLGADIMSQICDEEASQLIDRDSLDPESMTLLEKAAAQHDTELAEAIERRKAQVSVSITHEFNVNADSVVGDSHIPSQ